MKINISSAVGLATLAILLSGSSPAYRAPRNAYGQPDFEGNWTNHSLTPVERPPGIAALVLDDEQATALETSLLRARADGDGPQTEWWAVAHLGRIDGRVRSSWIVSPADGHVALTAEAKAANERQRGDIDEASDPEVRGPTERCLEAPWASAGPPMLNAPYNPNYKFVQTPDQVAILIENAGAVRIIRIGGQHLPSVMRADMGDSIGHWVGDTLVVETTNFSRPFGRAILVSADAKVTERFTRTSASEFRYEFVVDDPKVLAEPVRGEMVFRTTKDAIYEVACHEGNYGLEGILAGAREVEKAAKTAGK